MGLILFLISFISVMISSYFICSTIKSKELNNTVIYYILIAVSQIIISFEILSLLKSITLSGVLVINLIFLLSSAIIWNSKNRPDINFEQTKYIKDKIKSALLKDKVLLLILFFFIFSSLISLFLTLVAPNNSWDSLVFHLARIGFWLQNRSFEHFETGSIRQVMFPINSEILILWSMVFLKRDYLAQLPQYLAYLGCIYIMFSYLSYLKISIQRILWTIFIFASLPAVILESMSCQTDLLIAFFLFSSFYLFIFGVKENDKKSIIFSSISFCIAAGLKNTIYLFIPVFFLLVLLITIKEKKKYFYKPLFLFIAITIPAFLILSSYNYILNYMDFGNPFGCQTFLNRHHLVFGIKPFICNLIKNFFLFIDFTGVIDFIGIKNAVILNDICLFLKKILFLLFGLKTTDGLAYADNTNIGMINSEMYVTSGFIGLLIFLPLVLKTIFKKVKLNKDKYFYLKVSAFIVIGFIITLSALMGFCRWTSRYLITAVILSSPVFLLSYSRKQTVSKIIITAIVIFNFIYISTHNSAKPFFLICKNLKINKYESFREETRLSGETIFSEKSSFYKLLKLSKLIMEDNARIGLVFSEADVYYPFFEQNPTWKVNPVLFSTLIKNKNNFNKYDYLIFSNTDQVYYFKDNSPKKFYYWINGSEIMFDLQKQSEVIKYYRDKNMKPTTSKEPIFANDIINFKLLPANYKLLKKIEQAGMQFYIYKNTGPL